MRPGRDRLSGTIQADEIYLGGILPNSGVLPDDLAFVAESGHERSGAK